MLESFNLLSHWIPLVLACIAVALGALCIGQFFSFKKSFQKDTALGAPSPPDLESLEARVAHMAVELEEMRERLGERHAERPAPVGWAQEVAGVNLNRRGQVLRLRLLALTDELDPALLLGPVRARINRELRREQAREWKHLQAALSHPRYLALLAEIDAWVQHPPLQAEAKAPGAAVEKLVLRAERKVATRLKTANTTRDVADLHRARKAAKRARYAAEAGSPVLGQKRGKRHAKRYRWLQDLLGEHQDSVMSAEVLLRLGAKAGTTPGENGFAFGVMHERELRTAQRVRQQARRAAARY